jgi:hypothetical protein
MTHMQKRNLLKKEVNEEGILDIRKKMEDPRCDINQTFAHASVEAASSMEGVAFETGGEPAFEAGDTTSSAGSTSWFSRAASALWVVLVMNENTVQCKDIAYLKALTCVVSSFFCCEGVPDLDVGPEPSPSLGGPRPLRPLPLRELLNSELGPS